MTHKLMFASDANPNDTTGGGGCVCSPERQIDCKPPYVLLPGNEMDGIASPHVVMCKGCAEYAVKLMEGEILAAGEDPRVDRPTQRSVNVKQLPVPVAAESWDDVPEV